MRLADLSDPQKFTKPLSVSDRDPRLLKEQLRLMMLIRAAEEKIGDMVTAGEIGCPCHLAIGQEATAVGVASQLRNSDRIFGTHRSHGHFLAQGGSLESLLAEVLGKATGCSKGMGGSMHLFDEPSGFKGSVPIVAATVPLAVGAALASKMESSQGDDMDVGVAYFGDGTTEEGVVHESMNFAGKFALPMLFVVENNLFSSHLHIAERQPSDSVARYAVAHGLEYEVVDGNDVTAVSDACRRLLAHARSGKGAAFLEAVTYRWRGHVGPREDIDVGLKRSGELQHWKKRDPIGRLRQGLVLAGMISDSELEGLAGEVQDLVESAWQRAEAAPYPADEDLLSHVWAAGAEESR